MIHILTDTSNHEIIRAETSGMDLVNFTTTITTAVNLRNFVRFFNELDYHDQANFTIDINALNVLGAKWGTWGLNDNVYDWCKKEFTGTAEAWNLIYIEQN